MAWSASAEVANARPFVAAWNVARGLSAARWSATKNFGGTDITHADDDTGWLVDGSNRSVVRASAISDATRYLLLDLGASPQPFDCIAVHNPSYGALDGVEIEIANDNAFSSGLQTLTGGLAGVGSPGVIWLPELWIGGAGPKLITGARYIAITLTNSGGEAFPFVGEVWLGRRLHLPHDQRYPADPFGLEFTQERWSSDSGAVTTYHGARGNVRLDQRLTLKAADVASWQSFIAQTEAGRRPFVYCRVWTSDGSVHVDGCHIMQTSSPELELSRDDWGEYSMRLEGTEQPIAVRHL
jgi:hypothetical protein